jgi:uncharacterized protein YdbL (DUF1318 family)
VTVISAPSGSGEWVLLTYRLPREPSTPRSAVWRKLRKLGVVQISDGLVALPAAARTREQLEWIAEEVTDAGGTAGIWLARPATRAQEDKLTQTMAQARATEYQALVAATAAAAEHADPAARAGMIRRLRNELRAIQRRDYFPPTDRDRAEAAVQALADVPAEHRGTIGRSREAVRPAREPADRASGETP